MTLTPFRYPGSKNRLLPQLINYIDKLIVDSDSFVDVFVGGGSVLLGVANKYPKILLYANDKDYWMYCFWKVISDIDSIPFLDLLRLIDQKPTLDLFYKLREEKTTDEVQCAYRAIFFNRTTFSGIFYSGPIGGKEQKSQYKIDCRYNSKKLRSKLENCRTLLWGRTHVTNKDFEYYLELTESNIPAYLDPPYVDAGKSLYIHHMNDLQHRSLRSILKFRKNWVLSYDNDPLIMKLYNDCNINVINAKYSISTTDWSKKSELIILPR